jgi:mono/diheme cytochrome c family protein
MGVIYITGPLDEYQVPPVAWEIHLMNKRHRCLLYKSSKHPTMKRIAITGSLVFFSLVLLSSCQEGAKKEPPPVDVQDLTKNQPETHGTEIKESEIALTNPLNADWVNAGKQIYELKCQSCHRLTDEKLVGPGWKAVTTRRAPVWIMNMITNVEMMLEKDAEAQKLLELCMVRMPNQNITAEDARKLLEFMRQNDGEK